MYKRKGIEKSTYKRQSTGELSKKKIKWRSSQIVLRKGKKTQLKTEKRFKNWNTRI